MLSKLKLIAALALILPAAASTQTFQPPRHSNGPSPLLVAGLAGGIMRRATTASRSSAPVRRPASWKSIASWSARLRSCSRSGRGRWMPMS